MTNKDDRRTCERRALRLPVQVCGNDQSCTAWMLDANATGLLLQMPPEIAFCPGDQVGMRVFLSDERSYPLGEGIIRHLSHRDDRCLTGIELCKNNLLLTYTPMLGVSPQVIQIKDLLTQMPASRLNVLIRGETGTGKNVLARLIHDICCGPEAPFIRVNCPSIPESLFESELFGHEKGAYTDAKHSTPGLFRLANEGTILLDEISEIPPHLQAKLLSVIEDKNFMPVGGTKSVPVRARIIATTNVDLEQAVEKGLFRRDLYYRLAEFPFHIPPLRVRKEDIPLLAHYFLSLYCDQYDRPFKPLSNEEIQILENHQWPGNVREMENYMKQTALLDRFVGPHCSSGTPASSEEIHHFESLGLPAEFCEAKGTLPEVMKMLTERIEHALIDRALQMCDQNKTRAADQLGISYRTLLRKLG